METYLNSEYIKTKFATSTFNLCFSSLVFPFQVYEGDLSLTVEFCQEFTEIINHPFIIWSSYISLISIIVFISPMNLDLFMFIISSLMILKIGQLMSYLYLVLVKISYLWSIAMIILLSLYRSIQRFFASFLLRPVLEALIGRTEPSCALQWEI